MTYQIKSIRYQETPRNILLQNENGPCPLLAAANALLLRGFLSLPPRCLHTGLATIDDVVNLLADRAISTQSAIVPADLPTSSQHEYQLNEALRLLPRLQRGMDVNPKFASGPTGIEYTRELAALDALGIELVHGWLVDPQDGETCSAVGTKSYNELIELVVLGEEAKENVRRWKEMLGKKEECLATGGKENQRCDVVLVGEKRNVNGNEGGVVVSSSAVNENDVSAENDKNDNSEKNTLLTQQVPSKQADLGLVGEKSHVHSNDAGVVVPLSCTVNEDDVSTENPENDNHDNPTKNSALTQEETSSLQNEIADLRSKISSQSDLISQSEIIHNFLTATSHQLTYHGLERLHAHLAEDTLCVFFRNNHFATLTKHNGILYLLVTDLGYAHTPEIVWEKLDAIDGDTEYADEFFCRPSPRVELTPHATLFPNGGEENGATAPAERDVSPENGRMDVDREVALAWQREEERMDHESEQLARQLQELEYSRERSRVGRPVVAASSSKRAGSSSSGCVVS